MLKDKLKSDSVIALKEGNKFLVEVLRYLISLIDKKEMQLPPGSLKEADEVGVLRKELKNKEESVKMFKEANRADLYEPVEREIEILKEYLPEEMSEEQVKEIVERIIGENSINDFASVMRESMKVIAGRASGQMVSEAVKKVLG